MPKRILYNGSFVQAIELSLKEKLKQEHPILISPKIDSPKNAVSLETALNRLQHIGKINFSKTDIHSIFKTAKLRNRIVPFEFDFTRKRNKVNFC